MVYDDELLKNIFRKVHNIALVGASPNWIRPSNFAMKYLQNKGYRVIPVNPKHVGEKINNEIVYACLSDIPNNFEMVDIFRKSEEVYPIMEETIKLAKVKGIFVAWMQLGVFNQTAAKLGEEAELVVIMNRCPKIEYARLFGELSWSGINTGSISSKRPKLRQLK